METFLQQFSAQLEDELSNKTSDPFHKPSARHTHSNLHLELQWLLQVLGGLKIAAGSWFSTKWLFKLHANQKTVKC